MKKKERIIKIIAWVLIAAFIAQDIAWANPQESSSVPSQSTLGIPTLFQGIRAETDIKALEITLKYILQVIGVENVEKFRYHLTPEVAGVKLDLGFDKMRKERNAIIVPCGVSGERSYRHFEALINSDGSVSIVRPGKSRDSVSLSPPAQSVKELPSKGITT